MKTLAEINRAADLNERASDFQKYCAFVMRYKGAFSELEIKRANLPPRVERIVSKAFDAGQIRMIVQKDAVGAGTTTDNTSFEPLAPYNQIASGFLQSLAWAGVFDAALSFMLNLPLRTNLMAIASGGFTASTTGEALPKPLTTSTTASSPLPEFKSVAMIALSDQLLKHGIDVANLLGRELRRSVLKETDQTFLAQITSGLTPVGSTGETPQNFTQDLRNMLAELSIASSARLFLAQSSELTRQLATATTTTGMPAFPNVTVLGGNVGGIEVRPTDAVAAGTQVLFDASQLAGNGGNITVEASKNATLEMKDSSLTQSGATGTGVAQVSTFQSGMTALRAERFFGILRERTASVAVMQSAQYDDQESGS